MSGEHRLAIDEAWTVWRTFALRGTGFPTRDVLALAAPETAAAADRLLATEARHRDATARAMARLREGREDRGAPVVAARRRVMRALAQGRSLDAADLEIDPVLQDVHELHAAVVSARAEVDRIARDELERVGRDLRRIASDPRFREAVTWQSRSALRDGIDLLDDAASTSRGRRRERIVASYVQRYCTKNDSIGFFGPVGWGTFERGVDTVELRPGASLLARRAVYFEQWAIDTLAEALASDEAMKPYLAPRLSPVVAVDGVRVRYPTGRHAEVPPVVAALLARCDGETPARDIARALVDDPRFEVPDEDEVYSTLAELEDRKLVTWTLEVPAALRPPEAGLADLLRRIDDVAVRTAAEAALDRLVAARDRIAGAAGDPDGIDRALVELEQTFVELTGTAASRHHGDTYGARGLVYEDCRRDVSLRIGNVVLDRVGPVVALLGQSARWYTHEIATRYRAAMHRIHAELRAAQPGPVELVRFWDALAPLWPDGQRTRSPIVDEVATELARRWGELLRVSPDETRVDRSSRALAAEVARQFAAPCPGWPIARHVAPDLLIGARGLDAFARGDIVPVIGEIHLGNTLLSLCLLQQHPEPDALIAANDDDLGGTRIAPVESRRMVGRGDAPSWSARDVHVEVGGSRSWRPRAQVVRAADLVVEERGGTLAIVDRPSGRAFDAIAFFEQYLRFAASGHFKPYPHGPHVPRIAIDGVVLARERWELSPADVPIAEPDRVARFLAVRRWVREHQLPRHVFVKVPEETKPVYVDFDSPLLVELFAAQVRKASVLVVTEMLPDVDDTWLEDGNGHTYACELRVVALDPIAWTAPASVHGM